MEKLFTELKRINEVLQNLSDTEMNIKDLPYYTIFGNESERKRDLARVNTKRAIYLKKKHNVLESIQIECEKVKVNVSSKLKIVA